MASSEIAHNQDILSSSIIAHDQDILSLILILLPKKSITRFKCVSKCVSREWHSIINSPHFRRKLRNYCKQVTRLLVCGNPITSEYNSISVYNFENGSGASFNLSNDGQTMKIVQSCNGLLVVRTCPSENQNLSGEFGYYICNPTTLQYKKLPDPIHVEFVVLGVTLAFDPRNSQNFKVVCVYRSKTSSVPFKMEIYSSDTGLWRHTGDLLRTDVDFNRGIYCNGAVFWVNFPAGGCGMSLDIENEQFRTFPGLVHRLSSGVRDIIYSGESYDRVILGVGYRLEPTVVSLWQMNIECTGWFEIYEVDITQELKGFRRFPSRELKILTVVLGEDEVDLFVVLVYYGKAVRYNLFNKSFNRAWVIEEGEGGFLARDFGCIFHYIESDFIV